MQELVHSILKTQNSYLQAPSVKDHKESNEINERAEQLRYILQWVNKKVGLFSSNRIETISKPVNQYAFFMVKIECINGLVFRKVSPHSKVFVTLIGKLYNNRTGQIYPKNIRIVRPLQEASTYIYELRDPFCFYFYTSCEKDLNIKVQVLLSEQEVKDEGTVGVFTGFENAGMIEIDFRQDQKGKQKKALVLPNYFALGRQNFVDSHMNSNATATLLCSKSDAYRYLEKIIPENVLCDSKDKIAGVMGYFLPMSENALADFAITPEAQSITFTFTSIEINSSLLKEIPNKAQMLVKNRISNLTKVTCNTKDILIRVYFHNSWKAISEASSILHERNEPNLKTNQSNISQLNLNNQQDRRKSKQLIPSLAKINQYPRTKGTFKNYTPDQPLKLKLIFPQEDECVIIYQIVAEVVVRGEIESPNKKEANEHIEQSIEVPICFGVNSAKAISNYRAMSCIMNSGGCLVSFNDLKSAIELGLKQINSYKRINTSKVFIQSKPKLPSFGGDFDAISNNNRGLKTIGNISQVSTSGNRGQIGFLQFQMQLSQKQELNLGNEQNNSLLQNLSSLNLSKLDVRDKIQHEKERIVKQAKKVIVVKNNNIAVVKYAKGIVFSEQQRTGIGLKVEKKIDKYYHKSQFLGKLNQMVNKYYSKETKQRLKTSSTKIANPIKKIDYPIIQQNTEIQSFSRIPYNIKISNQNPSYISEHKLSKYYQLLYSNNWSMGQKNYYQYETLSQQIIKTQLSQINYNNCFFINFIQIGSYNNDQTLKYPKKFFFKLKFYNRQQIRSQIMTINKDTGEILLLSSNQTNKILHIQIQINSQGSNNHLRFIDFIEYLHNGMVNIEIVDYETGLRVGWFCVPLRGLVRKRRSEVVVMHHDVVYWNGGVRSTIKAELRAIRKMRNKQIIVPFSPKKAEQPINKQKQSVQKQTITEQSKQLNRIQRFKQGKLKKQSQIKSPSKIQSNQITKILDKVYSTQKQILHVAYLKKQFLFLQIQNKTDSNMTFYCAINDEDKRWIQMNSLSLGSELSIVKEPNSLEKDDYSRLTSTKKNLQKMMKCFKLNNQEQITLSPWAKGYLLLCYQTVRRYRDIQNPPIGKQLSIYNRQRKITCSIINDFDDCISVIHTIQVIPQPQTSQIELQFYRPAEQQSLLHLPFLDSNYFETGIDQILIDDPYVIVMPANYSNSAIIDRFTSKGSGIYIQTSNDIKMQDFREYHVLVLNDVMKKQALLQQSRKNEKGKSRKRESKLLQEYQDAASPKLITMTLRVWGCLKLAVEVRLWEQKLGTVNLSNHMFSSRGIQSFFLASEDEDTITFSQDRKRKHQSLQLLKVTPDSATTQVGYTIFSSKANVSFISINAINANSALEQQQAFKDKRFTYIQPIYRIVLVLTTVIPHLKQTLKINISRSAQGTMEQPFTYRSPANKKAQFRIYSSEGELVWVRGSDSVFLMESKSQRKVIISFNARRILERISFGGVCEGVILGVKWEKGIDYFGLRFNTY